MSHLTDTFGPPAAWRRPSNGEAYRLVDPEEHEQTEMHDLHDESEIEDWQATPLYLVSADDLADVWADGYASGDQDARAVQATYPDPTPNPYRGGAR